MPPTPNRLWRQLATGLAFLYIFFGGGVLATLVWPLCLMGKIGSPRQVRRFIRGFFRIYITALQRLGLLTLSVEGTEHLRLGVGRMIIANHPSLLDVVLLIALVPNTQCIVKHQLWNHRFLGILMRRAGFIRNDLPPETFAASCKDSLTSGESLIIFPEGTRSTPGAPLKLQRGFANLVVATEAPLQPVTITCTPPTLVKGERWWHIPARTPHFTVRFDATTAANNLLNAAVPRSIFARQLVRYFEQYYREHIPHAVA